MRCVSLPIICVYSSRNYSQLIDIDILPLTYFQFFITFILMCSYSFTAVVMLSSDVRHSLLFFCARNRRMLYNKQEAHQYPFFLSIATNYHISEQRMRWRTIVSFYVCRFRLDDLFKCEPSDRISCNYANQFEPKRVHNNGKGFGTASLIDTPVAPLYSRHSNLAYI